MSDNMKLVPLCRCNNCMRIYEDTNPQGEAHKFKVAEDLKKLACHNDMRICPECRTDEYLSDVGLTINRDYTLEEEFHILNSLLKWCDKGKIDADKINQKEKKQMFIHFKRRIYKEVEK